jgi:hypothetical protein
MVDRLLLKTMADGIAEGQDNRAAEPQWLFANALRTTLSS